MFFQADAKIVDLRDGFVRVETAAYSIEVPKEWKVSEETRWGQRKAKGKLSINGVSLTPPKSVAIGRQAIAYRTQVAVDAIERRSR